VLAEPAVDPARPERRLRGYYVNYGIRTAAERVRDLLFRTIEDGKIDWEDTEWSLVDPSTLDRTVRKEIKPVPAEGIWYVSGRTYYPHK
jgi:hypothetical protein